MILAPAKATAALLAVYLFLTAPLKLALLAGAILALVIALAVWTARALPGISRLAALAIIAAGAAVWALLAGAIALLAGAVAVFIAGALGLL